MIRGSAQAPITSSERHSVRTAITVAEIKKRNDARIGKQQSANQIASAIGNPAPILELRGNAISSPTTRGSNLQARRRLSTGRKPVARQSLPRVQR